jgi:hypothetical protein
VLLVNLIVHVLVYFSLSFYQQTVHVPSLLAAAWHAFVASAWHAFVAAAGHDFVVVAGHALVVAAYGHDFVAGVAHALDRVAPTTILQAY